jgi:hypothetical protein
MKKTRKSSLAWLGLLTVTLFAPGTVKADPFLNETFESYTENQPLVGPGGQGLSTWHPFPADSPVSTLIVDRGHDSEKALEIKNDDKNTFWLSTANHPSDAWADAVGSSHQVLLTFSFFVPEGNETKGSSPVVGVFLAVSNAGQGNMVISAANGATDDGKPIMVGVGKVSSNQWVELRVDQDFSAKTYTVSIVGAGGPANHLSFRMAQLWAGDTWGTHAQLTFAIPPGNDVLLDDIQASADELN